VSHALIALNWGQSVHGIQIVQSIDSPILTMPDSQTIRTSGRFGKYAANNGYWRGMDKKYYGFQSTMRRIYFTTFCLRLYDIFKKIK